MPQYIFDDEDNEPMYYNLLDQDGHNPTVYNSTAEMKAVESGIPFDDPPSDGCWNCLEYDGSRCHFGWNNNDESYYNPDTDDKDPDDWCPGHDKDESIKWEDVFDER